MDLLLQSGFSEACIECSCPSRDQPLQLSDDFLVDEKYIPDEDQQFPRSQMISPSLFFTWCIELSFLLEGTSSSLSSNFGCDVSILDICT